MDEELYNFREEWEKELNEGGSKEVEKRVNDETEATTLFLRGSDLENGGNLYEAIQCYKKAVQLVPDIEYKVYELTRKNAELNDGKKKKRRSKKKNIERVDDVDDDVEDMEGLSMHERIERSVAKTGRICTENFDSAQRHISTLPLEIIMHLLKWVVTSELDFKSLENFGLVCRGFYLCGRKAELWRLGCWKVWGSYCGNPSDFGYENWREMFIKRPRLHYNGCYISKQSYFRQGENSFQDRDYRPWHVVEYYRYIRFFPDGTMLMWTTATAPAQSVNQLRFRKPNNTSILVGTYNMIDRTINAVLHRQDTKMGEKLRKRRKAGLNTANVFPTYHLIFHLDDYKKRLCGQLVFKEYSILTGNQYSSEVGLHNSQYPPLWFSIVKSYTSVAYNSL